MAGQVGFELKLSTMIDFQRRWKGLHRVLIIGVVLKLSVLLFVTSSR